ncbi:MAG: DUF2062 domain-containing protein [Deferrisomatales bacterium]|nr:DUF2062 domain-containing protein [Deferrisomatales bacterium]
MRIPKPLLYFYYRCVRLHGRPREVAMGMAIGLAVGMTPTLGVQMLVAITLAAVLGQSKIAAGLGVWISNPITALPLYLATYRVGKWTLAAAGYPVHHLGSSQEFHRFVEQLTSSGVALSAIQAYGWEAFWQESRWFFALTFLGGGILTVPLAIGGYWLTYQGVIAYRLKVRHRRANRMHKWKWNPHDGWHRVSVEQPQPGG